MVKNFRLYNTNYLNETYDFNLVSFIGDDGMMLVNGISKEDVDFLPEWRTFTLRGYGQLADVPDRSRLTMSGARVLWNAALPWCGQMVVFKTREERDNYLKEHKEDYLP
jgi:hypothetical protein